MLKGILNKEHIEVVGLVGAGAIAGAVVQASGVIPLSGNIRDVAMLAVAVWGVGMGHRVRAIAAGFGAAAVTTLVGRNFPNLVTTAPTQ
jgi:hypothetical protein